MIKVNNVVKTFESFRALDGLTMQVERGSIYGLVGPNGAGKSTILRHIMGVYRPDSGSVLVDGEQVYENPAVKAKITAIPDELYYFNSASTRDMMRFTGDCTRGSMSSGTRPCGRLFPRWTSGSPSAGCPRGCRSSPPSGWPCAAGRRCWCWTSRWTAWTR